jgi:hypothetical protein
MTDDEIKQNLDYILKNGDNFQKKVISNCISSIHYEVCKKNEPINRKFFEDYKNRIERIFADGTNEQVSSLLGSLLVQEQNVAIRRANPK